MFSGRLSKVVVAVALVGAVAVAGLACGKAPETAAPQAAQALILQADIVTGSGGTVKTPVSCVLANQYKRGNQVVWRAKVIDPATAKPLDDTQVQSIEVKLPDGQTFPMKYGDHPKNNPTDKFWATSWVVPDNYPTGSLPYEVTAVAKDGRTGKFTEFNVAPSLLTIVQ